jgi:hypothetical protein
MPISNISRAAGQRAPTAPGTTAAARARAGPLRRAARATVQLMEGVAWAARKGVAAAADGRVSASTAVRKRGTVKGSSSRASPPAPPAQAERRGRGNRPRFAPMRGGGSGSSGPGRRRSPRARAALVRVDPSHFGWASRRAEGLGPRLSDSANTALRQAPPSAVRQGRCEAVSSVRAL